MAEIVFKLEELLIEEQRPLLELRNNRGESPLFVAAMHGNLNILKNMAKRVGTMDNLRKHFRRFDKYNALHASVIGQHFLLPVEYDNDERSQLFKQKKDEENGKEDEPDEENAKEDEPDEYDNDEHDRLFKQKKDEENGKEDESEVCKSGTRVNSILFF
ncbi:hypothetical protein V8G54_003999 [Vigna mungo]|uniref:Uncharacterized protein n=1 Tax=Vigna mungo TaxID=3915 RepID=A0AAQ3PBI0_VIGMU